jgi:hypothetical protein
MVYLSHTDLKVDTHKLQFESVNHYEGMDDEEINIRKSLLELELQSDKRLAGLLEQVITTPLFDEEGFWTAWREERLQNTLSVGPLHEKAIEKLLERGERILDRNRMKSQKQEKPLEQVDSAT